MTLSVLVAARSLFFFIILHALCYCAIVSSLFVIHGCYSARNVSSLSLDVTLQSEKEKVSPANPSCKYSHRNIPTLGCPFQDVRSCVHWASNWSCSCSELLWFYSEPCVRVRRWRRAWLGARVALCRRWSVWCGSWLGRNTAMVLGSRSSSMEYGHPASSSMTLTWHPKVRH